MSEIPPPQFSNYPRANYTSTPFGRPPGVYFDAISDAWTLVKSDLGSWVGATLLAFIVYVPMAAMATYVQNGGTFLPEPKHVMAPSDLILGVLASVIAAAVLYVMSGGMMRMAVKQVYGEPISALDVFAGFKVFGSVFGACLLMLLAIYLGMAACIIPGIFVSGALAFTPVIAVDQQVGGAEAVKRSFNALKPHAWLMFCLLFVAGLISGLGMCLCGVGVLFTYPIYTAVIGLHYTYFFPRNAQPAGAPMYMVDPVIEDK